MFSSEESSVADLETHIQSVPVVVEQTVDETEKFEQTYPMSAAGRVNISNLNGSITVEAWDRNEVKLEYTKIADSRERLADVEVKIDAKPDFFSVETDYGRLKGRNNGDRWLNGGKLRVDFRLMLPRGAVLNEVETVNGTVSVSNFVNIIRVSAVNGSVNAVNLRGSAKLSTVNGEVTADFDRLESGSQIALETVNGRANLVIPSDSNATVKADSLNGNITNDFGLFVRKGKYVGSDLHGRLGSGEVQIRLNSVNGGLSISRKKDGKSVNPAVDLLQQNSADAGIDKDSASQTAHINREVAKAVKESSKISRKALSDAKIEISRMQPELAKIAADAVEHSAYIMKSDEMRQKMSEAMVLQSEAIARIAETSFFPSVPTIETKNQSYPVKGTPKVTVKAKGCSVSVRGWDKSEVRYRVTHIANERRGMPLKITDEHSDSAVTLNIENTDTGRSRFFNDPQNVRVEIFVPHKSNLKIHSDSEIRLEGVSGDVELSGADEAINVRDVDGSLRVQNMDGRIRVIGFRGNIEAVTLEGTINLEGDFKSLKAHSSDGSILLTLPENASANLETSSNTLKGEGIGLTPIGEAGGKYRIGNGDALFQLRTEGEIRIRGAGVLTEIF